jgi:hypothetical protein
MSDDKQTIEFLANRVKQLELDVQYELNQTNKAQDKYENLRKTMIIRLNELLASLEVGFS